MVKKHVLANRLQTIREQHLEDLRKAMDSLKKHYEDIEQEAKEKMVNQNGGLTSLTNLLIFLHFFELDS